MEINNGYLPLRRSILNHRYFQDAEKLRFWIWCLLRANHTQSKIIVRDETIILESGQFLTGRKSGSEELNISEMQFRTLLKFFSEKEQKLTIKSTKTYTIVTVNEYDSYKISNFESNQDINQALTKRQPSVNQALTTDNKNNNDKNDKNDKKTTNNIYSELFEELWKRYPSKDGKKEAQRHFNKSVKTKQDSEDIEKAMSNYLSSERVKNGFIKNGSTWFNNWRDWIEIINDDKKYETLEERNLRMFNEMERIGAFDIKEEEKEWTD